MQLRLWRVWVSQLKEDESGRGRRSLFDASSFLVSPSRADMLFIGPNDLSLALGFPPSIPHATNPVVQETIAKILEATLKAGKLVRPRHFLSYCFSSFLADPLPSHAFFSPESFAQTLRRLPSGSLRVSRA